MQIYVQFSKLCFPRTSEMADPEHIGEPSASSSAHKCEVVYAQVLRFQMSLTVFGLTPKRSATGTLCPLILDSVLCKQDSKLLGYLKASLHR
jgi:hypothetical protein